MNKKNTLQRKSLVLTKQTLVVLQSDDLKQVDGAKWRESGPRTHCEL